MLARLWNLLFGWTGLVITGLEKANPQALLNKVQEDMRRDVAGYNQGLIAHAQHVAELESQTKKLERTVRDNTAKVAALAKVGNVAAAKPLALQLQKDQETLKENKAQLATASTTYQQLTATRDAAIAQARAKITDIKNNLSERQRNEALASLTESANGMINQIGSHADTLNRLSEYAEEGKNKSAGRLKVAAGSIDTSSAASYAAEQDALGDAALAQFMAEQGISAPGGTPAPAAKTDSMGPAATEAAPA